MKTIIVMSSNEGDALQVNESPWPRVVVANLVGRYNPRWGFDYRAWNAILKWCVSRDRELLSLPVVHSCEVSEKLWGNTNCWHSEEVNET